MRARITLAVVLVLAGALALAALVSFYLVGNASRQDARRAVLSQASALARSPKLASQASVRRLVESVAGVKQASILEVDASGGLRSAEPHLLISSSAIGAARLARGLDTSGTIGHIAFAAVPLAKIPAALSPTGRETVLALALESPIISSSDSVWYYLLAAAISLLVAAGASAVIARRISQRVVAASATAEQIASGDFDVRIPERRRTYPELAGLDAAINSMAADLSRARQLERQFFLSVSHDLRTPLTSIRGYSEAIRDGAAADVGRAAEVVVSEAGRLERLIGDLLDLARLDAHRFSLFPRPTDLGATVAEAAEAMRYAFETSGVELRVEVPSAPLVLELDPDRLRQIVANLVENALKFATSAASVTVRSAPGPTGVLAVEDDGPGITSDDLPHVFERLFTSNRDVARAAGTGLGLAIVAELTEAMGGSVEATSPLVEGRGTCIAVTLDSSASLSAGMQPR